MKKNWLSTNHTTDPEDFWCREMLKHKTLGCDYWIKVMQLAAPYYTEDGKSVFLKFMEESQMVEGNFKCQDLQDMFAKKVGCKVLTTFVHKGSEDLYPEEISIMFDETEDRIDHDFLPDYGDKKFLLNGTSTLMTRVYDKVKI